MNCNYHSEKAATQFCLKCKRALCEECAVSIDGRIICKTCINNAIDDKKMQHIYMEKYDFLKNPKFLATMFFTACLLPGCSHMYMGLKKRGLFIMSMFLLIIFISAVLRFPLLNLSLIIIYLTNFFDSLKLYKRIESGEKVEDKIGFGS